jgi:hypothetical protein
MGQLFSTHIKQKNKRIIDDIVAKHLDLFVKYNIKLNFRVRDGGKTFHFNYLSNNNSYFLHIHLPHGINNDYKIKRLVIWSLFRFVDQPIVSYNRYRSIQNIYNSSRDFTEIRSGSIKDDGANLSIIIKNIIDNLANANQLTI